MRRVLDGPPMPLRGGENRDWRPLGVWVVLALVDGYFQQCHHIAVSNTNEAERHLPLQIRGVAHWFAVPSLCSAQGGACRQLTCALVHEVPFLVRVAASCGVGCCASMLGVLSFEPEDSTDMKLSMRYRVMKL